MTPPPKLAVTVIRGEALTLNHRGTWSQFQQASPEFANPFYCPDYAKAVVAARDDVYVGILKQADRVVGFFPFQRRIHVPFAKPLGAPITDYHGIITEPGLRYDPREVLRCAGLAIWDFDYVPRSHTSLEPFHRIELEAPILDLTEGYAAYLGLMRRARSEIAGLNRKARKMAREVGPLRFVDHVPNPELLRNLIEWKTNQYRRTGAPDLFAQTWVRAVLESTFLRRSPEFAGMLSVLYAGDRVVAMHYGLRSTRVWHWWFPVYDPAYSAYSPGLVLLLRMAEHAASLGLTTIDLGHTRRVSYKQRFMTGTIPLWGGTVERPSVWTIARRIKRRLVR